jgi:5-methylcytosine-specific restriction endonuclease McrA
MKTRSQRGQAYQRLYKSAAWQDARDYQLTMHPLCARHLKRGEVVAAAVVHHVTPHKGDEDLFFDPSNLESLCKSCHDSDAQSEERRGYSLEIGVDGWPIDSKHPGNKQ